MLREDARPFVIDSAPAPNAGLPLVSGFSRTLRLLHRIALMAPDELASRAEQETLKWMERTRGAVPYNAGEVLASRAPAFAEPGAALQILREVMPRRFFAGTEHLSWVASAVPAHKREVIATAADPLQHRFDLLGYRTLWFGEPIDWHFDPVWARRAPRVHWSRLDPLDPECVGDSKIVWELNRHQWLVLMAQAHTFTGDERFADECLTAIDQWMEANPPGIGVNWTSSLEVSYRLMSWCWVLLLLRQSAALSDDRLIRILAAIWAHASHVSRYLSYYFSPNTHLTGEAMGLVYAGTLFQEFTAARQWLQLGSRILIEESQRQICADGTHFERSTCYQRYTAETYLQFLVLAARNGVSVPCQIADRQRRVMEFLMMIRQPDGLLPLIGDSDGGQMLPLVDRSQQDGRGVLALAAALFRRPDFAWAADGLAPEVAWLMGPDGVQAFETVIATRPGRSASCAFPEGGYAVMRSGWERDAHQMIVDVGPLGCPFSAGHGHADLLSVQISVFGEPCVVDAGTYCYTPEGEWRNFFRGTAAHSTVMVDGQNQAQPAGPFRWHGRPSARLRAWRSNASWDFLDADHNGYEHLPEPVTHRRRVIFVKSQFWLIVDDLTGEPVDRTAHYAEIGFQFAPVHVSLTGTWARAETLGGNTLWLSAFTSGETEPSIRRGEVSPIRGWISADYGQRQPSPMLVFASMATLPWRSITILVPQRDQDSASPVVLPLLDHNGLPIGLVLEDRRQSVLIDDHDFLITDL